MPGIAAGFLQRHPDVQLDLSARHDETVPATGTGSEVDVMLEHRPGVGQAQDTSLAPQQGAPTSSESLARAREIPGWEVHSSSLTSVTVAPSATSWNQRRTFVSILIT